MKSKEAALIKILLDEGDWLSSKQLSVSLNVSVRTIKSYISSINEEYKDTIQSGQKGYLIDTALAKEILNKEDSNTLTSSEDRVIFIINKLIKSDEAINAYDLSDEMYISYSTLKNELTKVKQKLSSANLSLISSSDNLSIKGLEKDKRKLLSSLLYDESNVNFVNMNAIQNAFTHINIDYIKEITLNTFQKYHYFINDYSLVNLVLHIAIAIDRIQHGYTNQNKIEESVMHKHEYDLSEEIISKLEKEFNIKFSKNESYELMLLLVSRATNVDYRSINLDNVEDFVGKDCLELVNDLTDYINHFYSIDLTQQDFLVRFSLHIKNLIVRSQNNYFSKNPLTDGIKKSCPLIYDCAVGVSSMISKKMNIKIIDDEIAYIAFHLGSAIEAQKELSSKLSATLYCPTYYDFNNHLLDSINNMFSKSIIINDIITDESVLSRIEKTDLLITTIPLTTITLIPTIQISIFFNDNDINNIQQKVRVIKREKEKSIFKENIQKIIIPEMFTTYDKFSTSEECINYLYSILKKNDYVNDNFIDKIHERENLSPTSFDGFAIPHSMTMDSKKTGTAILISKNPIEWSGNNVNLVMMLSFNKNDRLIFNQIFEPLTMILTNKENIKKVCSAKNYNEFIDILLSLY